jgi:LysR family transcriptional regulator, chromosome initiation inhibitor
MLDSDQLAALQAILRSGSFDRAATALGVTPPAISQRIRALEDRVGTALIVRGQPCTATQAGARLAHHAGDLALMEAAALSAIGAAAPVPTVRIAVNADSLATWILPALATVPDLIFDLVIDDQDHSADLLRRGEVQAAVTSHPGPLRGCDTWPLGRLRYLATASPGFAARWFPDGPTADALSRAPALRFNAKDRLQDDWAARIAGVPVILPAHRIASSTAFVEAALLGLGWGMNPEVLVRDHLTARRLVALVPDAPLDVALHWQVARLTAPALAPLTATIRRAAQSVLIA